MKLPMLAATLALACALPAAAQQPRVPIEQRLTADQMRATGLDQLTPAQLALLNQLLEQERAAVVESTREQSRSEREAPARVATEGRIRGRFNGWQAGTVITLEDGKRWRVTEGDYTTRAVESPRASIKPGMFSGWYLQVEGHIPTAKVRPVD